jgi:hypothetical protein
MALWAAFFFFMALSSESSTGVETLGLGIAEDFLEEQMDDGERIGASLGEFSSFTIGCSNFVGSRLGDRFLRVLEACEVEMNSSSSRFR